MIFQLLVFWEEDFNKTLAGKIRKYNWTEKKHIWFTLYGNNCAEHFFPTPFRTCRPYSTLVGPRCGVDFVSILSQEPQEQVPPPYFLPDGKAPCVWRVWRMSGRTFEGIKKLSLGCQGDVLRVS